MDRTCTICAHPAHAAIDTALETDRSLRAIAIQFGVSKTALHRHWQAHVSREQPAQPPPRIGPITMTRRSSRFWTFAKWILGIGVDVLVGWAVGVRPLNPPGVRGDDECN